MKLAVALIRSTMPTLLPGSQPARSSSPHEVATTKTKPMPDSDEVGAREYEGRRRRVKSTERQCRESREYEGRRRRGRSVDRKCSESSNSQCDTIGKREFISIREIDFRLLYEFSYAEDAIHYVKFGLKRSDGTPVVIKSCPKTFCRTKSGYAWVAGTSRMLNLCESAGICKVMDVYTTQQHNHVVMERFEGHDLLQDLKLGVRPETEVRHIARQILGGLKVLHDNGLVHRDLKLGNIMLNPTTLETKIIDFDAVSIIEDLKPVEKIILGTDGFIAPEVYEGRPSTASDMYALGVVIFRMLTKRYPHSLKMFDHHPGENSVGSRTTDHIVTCLKESRIDFNIPALRGKPAAISFLSGLLEFDPRGRPSLEEALAHEWLTKGGLAPATMKGGVLKKQSLTSVVSGTTVVSLSNNGSWSGDSLASTCEGASNASTNFSM